MSLPVAAPPATSSASDDAVAASSRTRPPHSLPRRQIVDGAALGAAPTGLPLHVESSPRTMQGALMGGGGAAALLEGRRPAANSKAQRRRGKRSESPVVDKGKRGRGDDDGEGDAQKRRRIWAACENCRKRKARCDGEQPCSQCIRLARSALPRAGGRGDGGDAPTDAQQPQPLLQRAGELCRFDWNRKPRGPKARASRGSVAGPDPAALLVEPASASPSDPASAAAADGARASSLAGKTEPSQLDAAAVRTRADPPSSARSSSRSRPRPLRGQPRSERSAGAAYVEALGRAGAFGKMPTPTSPSIRKVGTAAKPQHATPLIDWRGNRSGARRTSRGSHRLNESGRQMAHDGASLVSGSTSSDSLGVFESSSGAAPGFHSLPSTRPWNDSAAPVPVPPPPPHAGVDAMAARGHTSVPKSSAATVVASQGRAWSADADQPYVAPAAASWQVDPAAEEAYLGYEGFDPALAANPPWFTGPGGRGNQPLSFSPAGDASATAPPMSPRTINAQNRRASHTTRLLHRLGDYYTWEDRPYMALAVAQFSDLDAAHKLYPSRYLFGQVDGSRPSFADVGPPPPPTPAHLQLALLSVLAHRALLLPAERESKDLDLPEEEKRAAVFDLSAAAAESGVQAEFAELGLEYVEGELTPEAREGMLEFARRSWNMSHAILMSTIEQGKVDPLLVVTGYLLDMAASEDGIGSQSMAQMKAWLFDIIHSWNLHLLDLPMEHQVLRPEDVGKPSDSGHTPAGVPVPLKVDARQLVTDPVDRESVRRVVLYVCSSFVWTHSETFEVVPFDLTTLKLNLMGADDVIHKGSAWIPRYHVGPPVLSVVQVTFLLYGRVLRMLHTPLDDLLNNRGSEPDINRAIAEIESALDWARSCTPTPRADGTELPIFITAFMHTRTVEIIAYRLLTVLLLFEGFVAMEPEVLHETKGMRPAAVVLPRQAHSTMHDALAGGTGSATSLALQQRDQPSTAHATAAAAAAVTTTTASGLPRARRPRLHLSRDPSEASMKPLFEMDDVVKKALALLDMSAPPTEGRVGTAAGVTILSVARSLRYPRHLRTFARHAFALAAEAEATREAWGGFYQQKGGAYDVDAVGGVTVAAQVGPDTSKALWEVGQRIIDLLHALGRAGSSHAAATATSCVRYRDERWRWIEQRTGRRPHF